MKNVYSLLFASALLLSAAGCAGEQAASTGPVEATTGITTTTTTTTGTGSDSALTGFTGSTVALVVSGNALDAMFYQSLPNSPTNIRMSLDTTRRGSEIIIAYDANGYTTQATLGSVHPWNSGYSNTRYNGWVTESGGQIWKAFYQDAYGAVVVIIDSTSGTGDGNTDLLGGSIYFQNFPESTYPNSPYAPQQGPLKMCWEITVGPYDCRTFLVDNNVVMTSSLDPNNRGPNATNNYQLLGTFSSLSRSAAGF